MLNIFRSADKAASLDATGIGLSALCVVHCLLFPTAAAAAPLFAPGLAEFFGASHDWHIGLLAIAAPISLGGLIWGARVADAGWKIILIGVFGLILMAIGAAHWLGPTAETLVTLAGVSILAGAHLANWRARARAGHDHRRDCGMCETGDGSAH